MGLSFIGKEQRPAYSCNPILMDFVDFASFNARVYGRILTDILALVKVTQPFYPYPQDHSLAAIDTVPLRLCLSTNEKV